MSVLFSSIDVSGSKNKKVIAYPNITSADRTVGLPVPVSAESINNVLQFNSEFN